MPLRVAGILPAFRGRDALGTHKGGTPSPPRVLREGPVIPAAGPLALVLMSPGQAVLERPGGTAIPAVLARIPPAAEVNREGRIRSAVDVVRAADRVVQVSRVVSPLPEGDRDRLPRAREDTRRLRDCHVVALAREVNRLAVHARDEVAAAVNLTGRRSGTILGVALELVPQNRLVRSRYREDTVTVLEPVLAPGAGGPGNRRCSHRSDPPGTGFRRVRSSRGSGGTTPDAG